MDPRITQASLRFEKLRSQLPQDDLRGGAAVIYFLDWVLPEVASPAVQAAFLEAIASVMKEVER